MSGAKKVEQMVVKLGLMLGYSMAGWRVDSLVLSLVQSTAVQWVAMSNKNSAERKESS